MTVSTPVHTFPTKVQVNQRPRFSDLYKAYLAAFNEHDLEKTFSFLSPSLTVYYDGRLMASKRDDTISGYTGHWKKLTQPMILLEEPKELQDDYGVEVSLADRDEGHSVKVKYCYDQEDGK